MKFDLRTWARRLAIAMAALLALWLVAWAGVPPLVKWAVQRYGSEALGRAVTLGRADFRPWSLKLALEDLRVAGPAGATEPQFSVARIAVDLGAMTFLRFAPVIQSLEIDQPRVRVARTGEGHYDFDDIVQRFAQPAPADEKPSGPPRFRIEHLALRDGAATFDDRPVARRHELSGLLLTLPFISGLRSQTDEPAEPRLAFTFDGTKFDSAAQSTPFADDRRTHLQLHTGEIDLVPYKPYVPVALPVNLLRGRLQADLELHYELAEGDAAKLSLGGAVRALDWSLGGRGDVPLAEWRRLEVPLADVQPLARRVALGAIKLEGLRAMLARDASGGFGLVPTQAAPAAAPASAAPAASAASGPAAAPWTFSAASVELADARVEVLDNSQQPAVEAVIDGLALKSGRLSWPQTEPATVSLTSKLSGSATQSGTRVLGQAQLALEAAAEVADQPARQVLTVKRLALDELALSAPQAQKKGAAEAPAGWKQLELRDAQVDLLAHAVTLGAVKLAEPRIEALRGKNGAISVAGWPVVTAAEAAASSPAAAPSARSAGSAPAAGASADSDWTLTLNEAAIESARLAWRDEQPRIPAALELRALGASLKGFHWPRGEPGTLTFATDVHGAKTDASGRVQLDGRLGMAPVSLNGALRVQRLPLHAASSYLDGGMNLDLQRALLGWRGDLGLRLLPAGPEFSAKGDAVVSDLHVKERDPATGKAVGDDLLDWQVLRLPGIDVAVVPGAKPRVAVGAATLADFHSRLVIAEDGSFNLRDVTAPPGAPQAVPGGFGVGPAAQAPAASAPAAAASVAASVPAAPASAASGAGAKELPVDLRVGGLKLVNGTVDFSDHFVRPNYSAQLTGLNGSLGAFDSSRRDPAELEINGRMAGTADLAVRGKLNPGVRPPEMDVAARATDLELAPLTPYAGKYAGYAIDRGKLSLDVHYIVGADGRLDAHNRVVINQLDFGERIESPDATQLPVRLAVALLKDVNGVIDLDLPVQGSLDDPEFSIGGIVIKIIVNLLLKAVTSPFALIGGLFQGGAGDPSAVAFDPGTALVSSGSREVLGKVAQALAARPALMLTVTGTADPVAEAEAMRGAEIDRRLVELQRRERLRAGGAAAAPEAAASGPTGEERTRLLAQLYKNTEIPDKPRNAIGLAKDLAPGEMEAMIRKTITVDEDAARQLALARGIAVREALVAEGLPSERLFLAAPKVGKAEGDQGAGSQGPIAKLALTVP